MAYLMIAVIQENKKIVGYRIFDIGSKKQFMDVPADNIKQVMLSGKAEVLNLGIQNDEIVGTNGSIERYPRLASGGVLVSQTSPLMIISQLGDVGYTVVDYKGQVKKARTGEVVEYAKQSGIANGKVVMKDNIEFISSITGAYPIEKISPSKVKNDAETVRAHIALQGPTNTAGNSTTAKNTQIEVEDEIEDSDVFDVMTDDQKKVLRGYYVWYTVDKYKDLAKSIRLDIGLGKTELLAGLRGDHEWEFGGVWDNGWKGACKCTLKHDIRYEYYAVPVDDRDNKDAWIIFGSVCAADFFNIDKDDMNKLVKTRHIMSQELKLISDILANGQERLYIAKTPMIYAILRKLESKEKILEAFGDKIGYALLSFIVVKLPLPMSLIIECTKAISSRIPDFFLTVFPEYSAGIKEIYYNSDTPSLMAGGKEYLDFVATTKIEGDYAYDPLNDEIKRRDIGAYNKNTRYVRERLLSKLRSKALCRDFNYEELDNLLYCVSELIKHKQETVDKFKGTEYTANKNAKISNSARRMIEEPGIDGILRTGITTIYNSVLMADGNNVYQTRPVYYDNVEKRVANQRYIKYLRNELNSVEGQTFTDLLDKFYSSCLDIDSEKEVAQAKREEAEKERIKKEEAEREKQRALREASRIAKEESEKIRLANLDRENKERAAKALEIAKEKAASVTSKPIESNKAEPVGNELDRLRELMNKHPELNSPGIEIAESILSRGKTYDDMSPKEKWRIDVTLKVFEEADLDAAPVVKEKSGTAPVPATVPTPVSEVGAENKNYNLAEHPEINAKVQRIVSIADSVEMQEVIKQLPNVLKIAYTISKYNKASDKQLKHIYKAIEILDQA